jgi:hypothetical protein
MMSAIADRRKREAVTAGILKREYMSENVSD